MFTAKDMDGERGALNRGATGGLSEVSLARAARKCPLSMKKVELVFLSMRARDSLDS